MIKTKEYYINNLNVLYEDNHIIVIEKPINILSQKDITEDFDINDIVKEYLKKKYQKTGNVYLGLVHRLDRRVGGVMLLAKTSKAASRLSESMAEHIITKRYLVCVRGQITKDGTIEVNILKDEKNKIAIISPKGKLARLTYQVLNYDGQNTYVLVNLITGRYNQIRVSFAYLKHPLLNDYKYDPTIKINNNDLGLWCYELSFLHPVTKEHLTFRLEPKGSIWNNLRIK